MVLYFSFLVRLQACMDVARGYVDTLKLFIAAAKSGFVSGSTIEKLEVEMSQIQNQARWHPKALSLS